MCLQQKCNRRASALAAAIQRQNTGSPPESRAPRPPHALSGVKAAAAAVHAAIHGRFFIVFLFPLRMRSLKDNATVSVLSFKSYSPIHLSFGLYFNFY